MSVVIDGTAGITFPAGGTGNPAGVVVGTTDTQTLSSKTLTGATIQGGAITLGTAVPTTSGTSAAFTNLPSWVKRITLMFNGVSTSGTSSIIVQLGTGSTPTYTTTGYAGASQAGSTVQFSSGFIIDINPSATDLLYGQIVINNFNSNTWVAHSITSLSAVLKIIFGTGAVSLGAPLTAIQITMVNGTDTFDAGSINIQYE